MIEIVVALSAFACISLFTFALLTRGTAASATPWQEIISTRATRTGDPRGGDGGHLKGR